MDAKQPALTEQLNSSNGSLELVLSAVLFGLLGLWIDNKVGTTPIFLLVFTFAGFAGAAVSVYYRYRHDIAQLEAQRDAARAEAAQIDRAASSTTASSSTADHVGETRV